MGIEVTSGNNRWRRERIMHDEVDIKVAVRDRYAGHATAGTPCCQPTVSTCGCGGSATELDLDSLNAELGYDAAELAEIPDAELGGESDSQPAMPMSASIRITISKSFRLILATSKLLLYS